MLILCLRTSLCAAKLGPHCPSHLPEWTDLSVYHYPVCQYGAFLSAAVLTVIFNFLPCKNWLPFKFSLGLHHSCSCTPDIFLSSFSVGSGGVKAPLFHRCVRIFLHEENMFYLMLIYSGPPRYKTYNNPNPTVYSNQLSYSFFFIKLWIKQLLQVLWYFNLCMEFLLPATGSQLLLSSLTRPGNW